MKPGIRTLIYFLTVVIAPAASAVVSVDSMNYPAWIDRAGETIPLAPGDRLQAGETVRTGVDGRVWLSVEDGSVIKLGQGARFIVNGAEFRETTETTVLDAAFDVLRGAFRFTSNFFQARRQASLEVGFRVGAVTIGVRGTDIWGQADDDRDFVALLEGRIEVSSEGSEAQIMEQPLTLYQKNRGEPAAEVQPVEAAVVQQLAAETELDPALGIANTTGMYDLVLASLQTETYVEAAARRFRDAGYAVKIRLAEIDGSAHSRIVLGGLVDAAAADNLRTRIAAQFGVGDAWIRKSQ